MGKLFSSPIPSSKATVNTATTTSTSTSTQQNNTDTNETKEPTNDELRVQNILNRNRGRTGTITTSFRGVLSDDSDNEGSKSFQKTALQRKTLLGE